MQQKLELIIKILIFIFCLVSKGYGYTIPDYLIVNDIGGFIASKNPTAGRGPGELAGVGHFSHDHEDVTYEISYFNLQTRVGPEVQVTQHAGSDSDKWLLHELDTDFRNYYGMPGRAYGPRQIDGQTILEDAAGGRNYRWLSNDMVIVIQYHDAQMAKPEPVEVVKAYLTKHPSTLPAMKLSELRSPENKTIWIKDEMERRLWLCDKWFLQLQVGKTELPDTVQSTVKHLNVFLDYREKYYGINARDEKIALNNYLLNKDGTAIKNKLTEYKTWWSVNKTKSINLP
jgi:hypothetical protein